MLYINVFKGGERMNKKILIFGVLAALMLVTISFATAVTTNTQTTQKESPLYNVRTKLAIGERIQNLKTKFIGERLFFLPFQWLKNREYRTLLVTEAGDKCTFHGYLTCWPMCSK
jgi:hypothetical protein